MRDGKMVVSGSIEEITQRKQSFRTLEVELWEPTTQFPEFLEKWPTLSELKQTHDSKPQFEISHSGDREEIPEILSQLIEQGLKITSFSTRKSKVEDLFLEIESGSSEFDQN
jgi:ABC-type multidrug transport system ATPase subunit